MGNYFDGQTAKFISVLATCLPPSLTSHIMQGWILNPKGLKKALTMALIYPTRPERPDPKVPQARAGIPADEATHVFLLFDKAGETIPGVVFEEHV